MPTADIETFEVLNHFAGVKYGFWGVLGANQTQIFWLFWHFIRTWKRSHGASI